MFKKVQTYFKSLVAKIYENTKFSLYRRNSTSTVLQTVYGKTTDKWYMDGIRVHTSDIQMTYEHIRVTCGWYASTYEWDTDDMQVHTSDIRVKYEYIPVTYGWHTDTYEWHTDDIRVHTSDIRMTYESHVK